MTEEIIFECPECHQIIGMMVDKAKIKMVLCAACQIPMKNITFSYNQSNKLKVEVKN